MRRLLILLIGALSFIIFVIILLYVVKDIKSARPAVVHLKPGVAEGGDRDGEVATTDKYVSVETSQHGKEIFTWDQILYLSEKDVSSSKKLDRIVDLIDLLSKLGLTASVLIFIVGLSQYRQTQKWEREKFLATIVKEFDDWKPNRNAKKMIDSLSLYTDGRMIELFPDEEKSSDRRVFVANEKVYAALTTTPHDLAKDDFIAVEIRDCFDSFLSYMGTFCHYEEQGLITKDALSSQLGYWFTLFGSQSNDLPPAFKSRILAYGEKYGLTDFEKLVKKYSTPSLSKRIKEATFRTLHTFWPVSRYS